MKILERYDWPGNVRELKNVIESAAAIVDPSDGDQIEPRHLMFFKPRRRDPTMEKLPLAGKTLESIERNAIRRRSSSAAATRPRPPSSSASRRRRSTRRSRSTSYSLARMRAA